MPALGHGEIVGIQYLRGIAAMAVVYDHTNNMGALDKYFARVPFGDFLRSGARGVDVFFLISGFIIAVISLRPPDLSRALTIRDFAERRFARLMPMLWIAVATYVVLRLVGRGAFDFLPYLRAFTLFPTGEVRPEQVWTLRHEVMFYAVFALAFLAARRMPALLWLWFATPLLFAATPEAAPDEPLLLGIARAFCSPVNFQFCAGFLLGLLWLKRSRDFVLRLPVHPFPVLVAGMLAIMAISHMLGPDFPNWPHRLIIAIAAMPVVFVAIHARCPDGWLDRMGRAIGDASYTIYLFHPMFLSAILGIWASRWYSAPVALVVIVTGTVTIAATYLISRLIERRMIVASRAALKKAFG